MPNQHAPRNAQKRAGSFLLLFFLLTVAFGVFAQAAQKKGAAGSVLVTDKGKLNILLDGKSVGREEFEIVPNAAGWIAKGSTSLKPPQGASSNVTGSLTLEPGGAPITYDWTAQTDKTNGAHVVFANGVAK